jgi:hypothetical protein
MASFADRKTRGFFDQETTLAPEIIEGVIREGQICALGGDYGIGKSPIITDLVLCILNGQPWCGREVAKRPVISVDLESNAAQYINSVQRISRRRGLRPPAVPEDMDLFLLNDRADAPPTASLAALLPRALNEKLVFLERLFKGKPDALLVIDPFDLFFSVDKQKSAAVVTVYSNLRILLSKYPRASVLTVFNLRKKDRKTGRRPNLLQEPRDWLEDIAGTLDILSRCDVRVGVDIHQDDIRVVNGIRRGEDFEPLLVRPVGDPPDLAGFEAVTGAELDLRRCFTSDKQFEYWERLPAVFEFEAAAGTIVPRSSLSRLISRTQSLGLLERRSEGGFQKVEREKTSMEKTTDLK